MVTFPPPHNCQTTGLNEVLRSEITDNSSLKSVLLIGERDLGEDYLAKKTAAKAQATFNYLLNYEKGQKWVKFTDLTLAGSWSQHSDKYVFLLFIHTLGGSFFVAVEGDPPQPDHRVYRGGNKRSVGSNNWNFLQMDIPT